MSKRYAFWRTADGKRAAEAAGKNAPVHILAEIGRRATITPHGVTWQGSSVHQMQVGLKMALEILTKPLRESGPQ